MIRAEGLIYWGAKEGPDDRVGPSHGGPEGKHQREQPVQRPWGQYHRKQGVQRPWGNISSSTAVSGNVVAAIHRAGEERMKSRALVALRSHQTLLAT